MDQREVKIYAADPSPRLRYIAGLLLGDLLGLHFEIVSDRRKIGKHPVINYSTEKIPGAFRIEPSGVLSEKGTSAQMLTVSEWKSLPVFYQSPGDADIPFDIFSASFFLVTRYEEYYPVKRDQHGRFRAEDSLAVRNGFLKKPVVDLWTREFARLLIRKFPVLAVRRNEYRAMVTVDVDQPFAYLGKNLLRNMGGLLKDLTDKNRHADERYKVVTHGKKDPFEVFDYIIEKTESISGDTRFFFPVGDHSKHDQNPSWKNEEYRLLIRKISSHFTVGLHPSYLSADKLGLIGEELGRLRKITGNDTLISRFHFIRFRMPESYRQLVKSGIKADYSMGYPEEPGFRAGIAHPFKFFDLTTDSETDLEIFPFQFMDATLYSYKKLSAGESLPLINDLIDDTKKAGGIFISLWHNTSLQENEVGKEWRKLFENMLVNQQQ